MKNYDFSAIVQSNLTDDDRRRLDEKFLRDGTESIMPTKADIGDELFARFDVVGANNEAEYLRGKKEKAVLYLRNCLKQLRSAMIIERQLKPFGPKKPTIGQVKEVRSLYLKSRLI